MSLVVDVDCWVKGEIAVVVEFLVLDCKFRVDGVDEWEAREWTLLRNTG